MGFIFQTLINVCLWCAVCSFNWYSIGILLARYTKLSGFVITIANIIQTVPVIAMLAILILVMGLGSETVVLTVFLYALLPIINTHRYS